MKPKLWHPRHRIAIEVNTPTRDTDGSDIDQWGVFVQAWASIEPLLGREYMAAQSVQAETTHRIRMRYRRGIVPATRVKFGERVFDIVSVLDVEELHRELVLMCKESV